MRDGRFTGWKARSAVGLYIVLYSTSQILTKLSKKDDNYQYNPVSVTLVAAFLKLALSAAALYASDGFADLASDLVSWHTLRFAYPSAVYLIDDNLQFVVLYHLTPGEASLLQNVKVLATAVALRAMLKKKLSTVQWASLCILALALASSKTVSAEHPFNTGHVVVLLTSVIGSTGDVYNEKLLKDGPEKSIHAQNIKLYLLGILLTVCATLVYDLLAGSSGTYSAYRLQYGTFFKGWDLNVVCLVVVSALQGLVTSAIFKFLDNLVKIQGQVAGMLLTVALSAVLFSKEPALSFYLSVGIVANALFIYNRSPHLSKAAKAATRAATELPAASQVEPGRGRSSFVAI
ncbi:CMP-sialic acid transporter 1 [Diplonema papillatum]|nr:CMP-sialic acid transporter 1 [Diplonema papillatum]